MVKAKIVKIFTKQKRHVGYRLQVADGTTRDFDADILKNMVREGKIELLNYTLTKDNMLEPKRVESWNGDYFILNKDTVVARVNLQFGVLEQFSKLPYNFDDLHDWLDIRSKFSCARDVKKFFLSIGIKDMQDFIEVTHCVALYDTFWVKRSDSDLKWKDVSPYKHNYSSVISTYALEGIILGNTDKSYFSPVVATCGSFPHTWEYIDKNNIVFIKAGSKYTIGGSNSGREPFSEYYASIVAQFLGFDCVKYSIRNHIRYDKKVDTVTECKCFTTEDKGSVTADALGLNTYEKVIEYCKKLSKDSLKTCLDMLFLDCLLLNTDRHFGNIEFIVENKTQKVIEIAPIFDNNYALLPRFIEGYDTFNRSEYTARDGRSFEDLYKLVTKHKSYRKELVKLKSLKLQKPKDVSIEEYRLKFLNDFLQMQVGYLLKQ